MFGGKRMDTFIDKLAQKRNAQEIIRANTTAEAMKSDILQNQVAAYEGLLQEIRRVNLKTAENAAEAQSLLKECVQKMDELQQLSKEDGEAEELLSQIKELLQELFKQSDDFLHRENVKVYRNVQAALVEELNKQTEEWKAEQNKKRGNKGLLVLSILILIGVVADVAVNLLSYFTMIGVM